MLTLVDNTVSTDGSTKFLWRVEGGTVESVSLCHPKFHAFCVSSQIGCSLGCELCATGVTGLVRSLTQDEIAAQVDEMMSHLGYRPKRIIVSFMGMGEPLLNLAAVAAAAFDLEARHAPLEFDLATVGVVPKIYELARVRPDFLLQLSLHAPCDELRDRLIPMNRRYPLREVIPALRYYASVSARRPFVNYVFLRDINDDERNARKVVELLVDLPVELKLARYNPIAGSALQPSPPERVDAFRDICIAGGLAIREFCSLATDIQGGCGQLRASVARA